MYGNTIIRVRENALDESWLSHFDCALLKNSKALK